MAKKEKDEIDKFLDVLFAEGFEMPDFSEITVEGFLESFRKDPMVISAEYKDGSFHVETVAGPFDFKFSQEKIDA